MESRRSRSSYLSTRLVLVVGIAGLFWLCAAGLLLLHLDSEGQIEKFAASWTTAEGPPKTLALVAAAPDSREESSEYLQDAGADGADVEPSTAPDDAAQVDAPDVAEPRAAETAEPPDGSVGESESAFEESHPGSLRERFPSLASAYDEPVAVELAALIEALYERFETHSSPSEPELNDYIAVLVGRINSQGQPYVVRLRGHEIEDVRRRAVRAHAMLVAAGLRPWLLEAFGERGSPGVNVDFAF